MSRSILLIFLALVLNSGCSWFTEYVYVHDRFPIIDKPKIGQMSEVSLDELNILGDVLKNKVLGNIIVLRSHNQSLEAAIEEYNRLAKVHNESLVVEETK